LKDKENEDRGLSDDVVAIVDEFIRYRKSGGTYHEKEGYNSLSKVSSILLWLTVVSWVLLMVILNTSLKDTVSVSGEYRVIYYLFALFVLIILSASVWVEYQLSREFFKDVVLDHLNASRDRVHDEVLFFARLSKYSLLSLKHVQFRFNESNEFGNSLVGLFVGFISKTGIIPAVILLILAILNVNDQTSISIFGYLSFASIVIYFISFKVMMVVMKYKSYSDMLGFYIENYRNESE